MAGQPLDDHAAVRGEHRCPVAQGFHEADLGPGLEGIAWQDNTTMQYAWTQSPCKTGDTGYASGAATGVVAGEALKRAAGIDLLQVPYKGNPQIMADLIPGRISAAVLSSASIIGPARGGQVKVLAVMNGRRTKAFPEVPTVAEAGFGEATVSPTWFGLVMRTGTPPEIVKRVAGEVEKAAKSPELMAQLEKLGAEPAHLGAEEFDALIRRDMNTWSRVIRESGMKLEN